jgi:hypothetical protein
MRVTTARAAVAAGSLTLGIWAALGGGLSYAASPSQTSCERSGGTFFKVNGTVTCTFATSDPVGNSESSGGKSQSRDTTTTNGGQGNLGNKDTTTSSCVGPGNAKCH